MTGDIMRRDAAQSIIELCRLGLDAETLRSRLLPRLRRAVPVDGLWWATVDPATLLFTGTYQEEIPDRTKPYFLENEFIADDVNKWVEVARAPPVYGHSCRPPRAPCREAHATPTFSSRSVSATRCGPYSGFREHVGASSVSTVRGSSPSRQTRRSS